MTPTKQFTVGDGPSFDFQSAEIEALIYKIAHWFGQPQCDRNYADPLGAARKKVQECLLAETEDGSPWRQCPKDFNKRIRAKCAYDMEKGEGIPSKRLKSPIAQRELAAGGEKAIRDAVQNSNPVLSDFNQDEFRAKTEADILTSFPELDNPAHRPNVRSLSMYYAQREVIDRELAIGVRNDDLRLKKLDSLRKLEEMADTTMRRLGVHPDQMRKKIDSKTASSVADLVNMIEADEDFKARERTWALQFALQCWWMSEHHNGRKTGPQLHDFEIWHMTRSRPMHFTCRHGEEYTLVEGFTPRELRDYLVARGVLVEEPVVPALISAEDLKGLDAHLSAGGNNGGEAGEAEASDSSEAESGTGDE